MRAAPWLRNDPTMRTLLIIGGLAGVGLRRGSKRRTVSIAIRLDHPRAAEAPDTVTRSGARPRA
jgi:hypothetical protein